MNGIDSTKVKTQFDKEVLAYKSFYEDTAGSCSWAVFQRRGRKLADRRKKTAIEMLNFEDSDVVLDVGCAGGYYGLEIKKARNTCRYIGIDISQPMLKQAQAAFKQSKIKGEFVVGDVFHLPLRDCCASKLFLIGVLTYYSNRDMAAILEEIKRVLRWGGTAMITRTRFDPLNWLRSRLPNFVPRPLRVPGPVFTSSKRLFVSTVVGAGFHVVRVRVLKKYLGVYPALTLVKVTNI